MVGGCTHTRQGGMVGLPRYMLEEDTVDWRNMRVKTHYNKMFKGFNIPNDISLEDKHELERLLAVTPEERKFLMSFCLCKVHSWTAVKDIAVPTLTWMFAYFSGFQVNNKFRLFEKPRFIRVGVQGIES